MKIILPITQFYETFFDNTLTKLIVKSFNQKEAKLFEAIKSGKIATDKQAATMLYDGNPSGQAYCKMKQGMIDKLTLIIINYDHRGGTEYAKKFYNIQRNYHAYRIMLTKNMSLASFKYGQKLLIQAERAGLYDIGLYAADQLSMYSKIFLKDKKKGDYYMKKYKEFQNKMSHETYVQHEYADLISQTRKKKHNEKLSQLAFEAEERIRPLLQKDNMRAMQSYYQIRYLCYAAVSEHRGVIESNTEAIEFFKNFQFYNQSAIDTLTVQLVTAYLSVGDLDKAINYLEIQTNEVNDHRWFNKISLKVRILLALQRYTEANELINTLFESVRFKQTETVFQEQMWLCKYYNDLMNHFEYGTKINTRRIRNNMTRIASDKQGLNIPLLIAETIHSIQKDGIIAIYGKEDQLKNYIKSHLKSGQNKRASLFLKFLINLPNSIYDKRLFNINLQNLRNDFEENPATLTVQPDNEVIPYENLMQKILTEYVYKSEARKEKRVEQRQGGQAPSES